MISTQSMQHNLTPHGDVTSTLSLKSNHVHDPKKHLRSTSLQSFDHKKHDTPKKSLNSLAHHPKSGHVLQIKRRDQILENFIKETEKKYKECSSPQGKSSSSGCRSKGNSPRPSTKSSQSKTLRFESFSPENKTEKPESPFQTQQCQPPPDKYTPSPVSTEIRSKTLSPDIRIEIAPESPADHNGDRKFPGSVKKTSSVRRSASYKHATERGASNSADKRLKAVLIERSKQKRQQNYSPSKNLEITYPKQKPPLQHKQTDNDEHCIKKESQSSISSEYYYPSDTQYSGVNVDKREVEVCYNNRNTLEVNNDANSGQNANVDISYNKSNSQKGNSTNGLELDDRNVKENSSKVSFRRKHRQQQADSLRRENNQETTSNHEISSSFQVESVNGPSSQISKVSDKSNFAERKAINEKQHVPIECSSVNLNSELRINSIATTKNNQDNRIEEESFKSIDPTHKHKNKCAERELNAGSNSNVLDNCISVTGVAGDSPTVLKTTLSSEGDLLHDGNYYNKGYPRIGFDGINTRELHVDNGNNVCKSKGANTKLQKQYRNTSGFTDREHKLRSSPYNDSINVDKSHKSEDSTLNKAIKLNKRRTLEQKKFKLQHTDEYSVINNGKTQVISPRNNADNLNDSSKKLTERLKQSANCAILPNKLGGQQNLTKQLKSKSHDSFHDKHQTREPISHSPGNTPPVSVGSTQLTSISSRSVYLTSQSCENFSQFGKSDFKAALKRLKNTVNSPSPVTSAGKRLTPTRDKCPNTALYEIAECSDQKDSQTLIECTKDNEQLPSAISSFEPSSNSAEDQPEHESNSNCRRAPPRNVNSKPFLRRTRPYLASKSQVIHPSNTLPIMKSDDQKYVTSTMPSYAAPIKMRPNLSTTTQGAQAAMLQSRSHDAFNNRFDNYNKQLDVSLLKYQQVSSLNRRREGPRAHLQSNSSIHFKNGNQSSVHTYKTNVSDPNTQERPKTGRGFRSTSPEYLPSENESVSLFSETCSTISGHSDNLADNTYVDQYFSQKTSKKDRNSNVRPKSSKGRERVSRGQSTFSSDQSKSGSIMEAAPWKVASKPQGSDHKTSVFMRNVPITNSLANTNIYKSNSQINEVDTGNVKTNNIDNSPSKARPKSAKGRVRPPKNEITTSDPCYEDMNDEETGGSTAATVVKKPRPKSSKGRVRVIPEDDTSYVIPNDVTPESTTRPKSAKGKIRHESIPIPTQPNNSLSKMTAVKHEKSNISIDSVPFDPHAKGHQLERKQQRRHISTFQDSLKLNSFNVKDTSMKNESGENHGKYCKPQTDLDIDSGNDTDVDGEIEILDLDKLDSDDDFVVDKPVFIHHRNGGVSSNTTTNSSRSSRGSSETSTAAWDVVNVYPHGNHNKQHVPLRQGDNKGVYDACLLDTTRLTPKEVAIIKSQNYEQINRNNPSTTVESKVTYESGENIVKVENRNMRKGQKSSIVHGKYESIDYYNSPVRTGGDASKYKQYNAAEMHPDVNNIEGKNITKYRQRLLSNPSVVHDNKTIFTTNISEKSLKPRKLQPIGVTMKEASGYRYDCNVNNSNAGILDGGANNEHVIFAGIPTKPQRARKNKPKKIEKLTIIHGDSDINSESPFDSSFYSDSPGYLTDGSLSFEYNQLSKSKRRMSDNK